jgi:uncharacterized protein
MNRLKGNLLIVLGTLSVGLGVIGIFLPILPTTPFLLLATYCYARSSKRFYYWLINNRFFGEYIRNYREKRGMTLRHKLFVIFLLWLTIGLSAGFFVPQWWLKAVLIAIATGVTIHIIRIKTYKPVDPAPGLDEKLSQPENFV